jgi:glycosyltransferase involved in cell wall biosynthesis
MITGVVLAHNEEHNIDECLSALRPHVAELIVIDTESTDGTVRLARKWADRVLSHPNSENFDAIRNTAVPKAQNDWLWFVDADERVPARTGQLVSEIIRERGHDIAASV